MSAAHKGTLRTRGDLTPEQLPIPRGARLLCKMVEIDDVSVGGIVLSSASTQQAHTASQCMQVLSMGPMAYQDPERFPTGAWCEVGQYVLVKPFVGVRLVAGDVEYRFVYDDMVEGIIPDPTVFTSI